MKGFLFGALLAVSAISAHAQGNQPALMWCDGCSDAQKKALVLSTWQESLYIADLTAHSVRAYQIVNFDNGPKKPGTQPSPDDPYAAEVTAVSPYKDAGNALVSFYYASPVGWSKGLNANSAGVVRSSDGVQRATGVPYSKPGVNVYDVVLPGPDQNNLTDWVEGLTSAFLNSIPANVEAIASTFKIIDAGRMPLVQFTINFDDGSHIDVKEDFSTASAKATVVPDTGRDSHNNNVPSTKQSALGGAQGASVYKFGGGGNPSDYGNWLNMMNLWDIPVTGGGGGTETTYKCGSFTDEKGVHVFCVKSA